MPTDRVESVRLFAFLAVMVGMGLTIWAVLVAFPNAVTGRLTVLTSEAGLLLGATDPGTPDWAPWVARAGAAILIAACATVWRTGPSR